jgi:hypothetical protein
MPGNLAKFVLPTGYETDQRKIARREAIAQALLSRGMQTDPNMRSWTQVLGQVGTAAAGKFAARRSDKDAAALDARMLNDYRTAAAGFSSDASGTPDPQAMIDKYGSNAMLQDDLAPYRDALKERITGREKVVHTPTGYQKQTDVLGKPEFDPNAGVIPDGNGGYMVNPAHTTAALLAQGFTPGGAAAGYQPTIQDPTKTPPIAANPMAANSAGMMDVGGLSAEERQILQNELARRAGGGSPQLQTDTHTPMGSPLSARRAPAGIANGKPYWLINGIPYDNPEGR